MRVRRARLGLVLGLAWLVLAGCRTPARKAEDPFAAKGKAQAPTPTQPEGVQQASYQSQVVPPGTSLADLDPTDETLNVKGEKKTGWQKTVEYWEPAKIKARYKRMMGRAPNERIAEEQFEEGLRLFKERKFAEAIKCFKKAADRWPDTPLEEDALFYQAECYFFSDRYPKASDKYGALLKKNEGTPYLDTIVRRQFAIAQWWEECARRSSHWYPNLTNKTRPLMDARGRAVSNYNSIKLNQPNTLLAADCSMAIANSYFLRNRYEEAGFHYDEVCKSPADTPHRIPAHLLQLQSKLRSYQGSQYEVQPLKDAEKLIDLVQNQFSTALPPEELERLDQYRKSIKIEFAHRDFQAGEYYYKLGYFRAARIYYEQVVRDYFDTPIARMAEARLEETKDYPPVPFDYFAWITKVLPVSEAGQNR